MSIDDYIHHPLNTSASKNVQSFSKNRRFFPSLSPKSNDLTYDLPDTKNKRTCGFGFGTKIGFLSKSSSPPPNNYTLKSPFQTTDSKGFSFGLGREDATFGSAINIKKRCQTLPGPGEYPLPSTILNKSIYMGIKLDSFADNKAKRDVPGPGFYSLKQTEVKNSGRYVLSNYTNPLSPNFRSRAVSHDQSTFRIKRMINLGPGSYESSDSLNAEGKYYSTKYPSSRVRSFGKSRRNSLMDKTKVSLPGPGTYQSFSEFGNAFKDIKKVNIHIRITK